MKTRLVLAQALALAVVAAVVCGGAGAAAQTAKIGPSQVLRAFKKAGAPLYNPGSGLVVGSPVTTLSTLRPIQGWNAAVYIYPNSRTASATFRGNGPGWVAAGMAVQQVRNIVVTVVPRGRALSRKAKRFPMPQTVVKAIGYLTHPAG